MKQSFVATLIANVICQGTLVALLISRAEVSRWFTILTAMVGLVLVAVSLIYWRGIRRRQQA